MVNKLKLGQIKTVLPLKFLARMPAALLVASPQARLSYLALYSIRRTFASFPARLSSDDKFKRSDFSNQSFTGYYEPGQPTTGPIRDASPVPRITPRSLKDHLDLFVVGQDRAKRVLSVAVYNHYQRVQELKRRDDEEDALLAQQERYAMRHPVEGMSTLFLSADLLLTYPT